MSVDGLSAAGTPRRPVGGSSFSVILSAFPAIGWPEKWASGRAAPEPRARHNRDHGSSRIAQC